MIDEVIFYRGHMLRFSALVVLLLCLSAPAFAAPKYSACAKAKTFKTPIIIDLQTPDPVYNLTLSYEELNSGKNPILEKWVRDNKMEQVWQAKQMDLLGRAEGASASMTEVRALAAPFDKYGTSWCPYIQSVRVNVIYRTIISIPNTFKQGGCMFNHILEHEQRHHITNATVAHEIVARLEKDLPLIILEIENSMSYAAKSQVDARFTLLQHSLSDAVQSYMTHSMKLEMEKRNLLIDTPEEYKRAGVAMKECKGK